MQWLYLNCAGSCTVRSRQARKLLLARYASPTLGVHVRITYGILHAQFIISKMATNLTFQQLIISSHTCISQRQCTRLKYSNMTISAMHPELERLFSLVLSNLSTFAKHTCLLEQSSLGAFHWHWSGVPISYREKNNKSWPRSCAYSLDPQVPCSALGNHSLLRLLTLICYPNADKIMQPQTHTAGSFRSERKCYAHTGCYANTIYNTRASNNAIASVRASARKLCCHECGGNVEYQKVRQTASGLPKLMHLRRQVNITIF